MLAIYKKQFKRNLEPVKTRRNGNEVCNLDTCYGRRDYKRRVKAMWERQHGWCAICGWWMKLEEATFEHEDLRGAGRHDDRIEVDGKPKNFAVHGLCNGQKGSKRLVLSREREIA